jgi:hypothetical protein
MVVSHSSPPRRLTTANLANPATYRVHPMGVPVECRLCFRTRRATSRTCCVGSPGMGTLDVERGLSRREAGTPRSAPTTHRRTPASHAGVTTGDTSW